MTLKINYFLLFFLCAACHLPAQSTVLTLENFLTQVRREHPAARQATLLGEQAAAQLQAARGAFDPKLFGEWEKKSFDGKTYFSTGGGGLKLPTWFGLEGKAAYHFAEGAFLNPENKLPAAGQASLGVTASLLQGLLLDERRAGLLEARILQKAAAVGERQMRNDLLLAASKTYWEWALAHAQAAIFRQAVQVAQQRFEAVRTGWQQGDRAAIDTLEAFIQVQDRQLEGQQAQVNLQTARLELQNFWWQNNQPLLLDTTIQPADFLSLPASAAASSMPENADSLLAQHPEVQAYIFKLEQLAVQRRWKAELLKPRLDVSYNLLADRFDFTPEQAALFGENYKFGAALSFPLFLRKERGNLAIADLKILDTEYALAGKRQMLRAKLNASLLELDNLRRQIETAAAAQTNQALLLAGENEKFRIGESSLFLVNSRENKLLDASLKLVKLQAELGKAVATLRWASGQF